MTFAVKVVLVICAQLSRFLRQRQQQRELRNPQQQSTQSRFVQLLYFTMSALAAKLTNPATYSAAWAQVQKRAIAYYHPDLANNG